MDDDDDVGRLNRFDWFIFKLRKSKSIDVEQQRKVRQAGDKYKCCIVKTILDSVYLKYYDSDFLLKKE